MDLETIESYFHLAYFDSREALKLGCLLVELSDTFHEQAAIFIIRESDACEVFSFIDNDKKIRNKQFAMAKRKAVLETGHCSLWGYAHHLALSEGALAVGGAFPIFVGDEHCYTVAISGLHHGHDFTLMIKALEAYLDCEIPPYEGEII